MTQQSVALIHIHNYQRIKQHFYNELILASENKPSSISFISHQLPEKPLLTKGIVQGIVIGGTNFTISTEELQENGTRKVLERTTGILPIFATRQTFVDFLSHHLDARADAIGMNFGFELKPSYGEDGSLDGFIQAKGTKDHKFTGLTESIGKLVKKIFVKKYHKHITTAIANDTVCLLLCGKGNESCSLIAGTGFNMGIRVKNTNNTAIINLETGGFDKFEQSEVLKKIDARTKNPGKKNFEKTVSGKYLALYFNEKLKELNLPIPPIATSQELSELSHTNHADVAGDLARSIIERSAFLVATAIAAVYEFSGKPDTFTIIGEGSLLWDGWHYYDNIQNQLTALGIPSGAVKIKHIKDSSINGAIGLVTQ